MVIKSCYYCKFHEVKKEGKERMSYCGREKCWSRYTKCVAMTALNKFLEQECSESDRPFSALTFEYSTE